MKLVHPDLPGQTINVPDSTARVLRRSGWTDPPQIDWDPSELNVGEVLDKVGDDVDVAAAVYAAEAEGRNRSTITGPLSELLAGEEEADGSDDDTATAQQEG